MNKRAAAPSEDVSWRQQGLSGWIHE